MILHAPLPGFPFSNKLNFCVPASRFGLLVRRCLVYGAQVPSPHQGGNYLTS